QMAAAEHVPGKMVAKAVMAFADDQLVMLVLPATYVVDSAKAAGVLGVRALRLASEREFADAFPDCEVGALPVFGQLYGLPVYADASLSADETITFAAGTHTESLGVRYADFERLVKPTLVELARQRAGSTA